MIDDGPAGELGFDSAGVEFGVVADDVPDGVVGVGVGGVGADGEDAGSGADRAEWVGGAAGVGVVGLGLGGCVCGQSVRMWCSKASMSASGLTASYVQSQSSR